MKLYEALGNRNNAIFRLDTGIHSKPVMNQIGNLAEDSTVESL